MMTDEKADQGLLAAAGIVKKYSTSEVAKFFNRTDQWVYWVLREGVLDKNGKRLEAERVGKANRRRFTLDLIQEMLESLYNRGTISEEEAIAVQAKINAARG
ncbi:conserved hypothetical protein [Rhodococcus phage E3]|uniref:hypothetical protein n=1 Tax=Rhodococcus phage E3 TaxID=1007869 RepID=UPI0002C6A27B|nr:hypothetical protein M176_gp150 [Rhodococcus phage E3]AEQ21058.1 conserved hypothetical protein [Rhodococcus phage E3]